MVKTIVYCTVLASISISEEFYLNLNGMKDIEKERKK